MATKDYFPKYDAGFIIWFENFISKGKNYETELKITPEETTEFQTWLTQAKDRISEVLTMKTSLAATTKKKVETLAEIEKKIRNKVGIYKRLPAYNEAIGRDLGIIAPITDQRKGAEIDQAKPEFSITVLPDTIRIDWLKGPYDGVVVHGKRGAETDFTPLDKDTVSPYEDARTNLVSDTPETRSYRLRYLMADHEIGLWSDEHKVVCLI